MLSNIDTFSFLVGAFYIIILDCVFALVNALLHWSYGKLLDNKERKKRLYESQSEK